MYLGEREGGDSVFCETSRLKLALLTSAQFVLFIIKPKQFLGMLSFINWGKTLRVTLPLLKKMRQVKTSVLPVVLEDISWNTAPLRWLGTQKWEDGMFLFFLKYELLRFSDFFLKGRIVMSFNVNYLEVLLGNQLKLACICSRAVRLLAAWCLHHDLCVIMVMLSCWWGGALFGRISENLTKENQQWEDASP